jgi:hypothetical protein
MTNKNDLIRRGDAIAVAHTARENRQAIARAIIALPAAPMGVNGLRVTGPNSDGEYWLHLKDGVNDLGMNLGADHGIIGGKLLAIAALLNSEAEP